MKVECIDGKWKFVMRPSRKTTYRRLVPENKMPRRGHIYEVVAEQQLLVYSVLKNDFVHANHYILKGFPGCCAFLAHHFKPVQE